MEYKQEEIKELTYQILLTVFPDGYDIDSDIPRKITKLLTEREEKTYKQAHKDFFSIEMIELAEKRGEERMKRAQKQTDEYYKLRIKEAEKRGAEGNLPDWKYYNEKLRELVAIAKGFNRLYKSVGNDFRNQFDELEKRLQTLTQPNL